MTPANFIENAISQGVSVGPTGLTLPQRRVFLISQAEVDCDMNGIDTFLDHYDPDWLLEAADAFQSVGASAIAAAFARLAGSTERPDQDLDYLNSLITDRHGYGYNQIVDMIAQFVPFCESSDGE